jgi:hypothetical protein
MFTDNDGKISLLLMLALLVILVLTAGAGFVGYKAWSVKAKPRAALFGMKMNADILDFSHRLVPDLYRQLISLDDAIVLLDKEQAWLKQIEKQYPDQKQIILDENESLKKNQQDLVTALTTVGKAVEAIYVTYVIDQRKGMALIEKQRFELKKQLSETLKSVGPLIARLKTKAKGNWTDRVLDLLN